MSDCAPPPAPHLDFAPQPIPLYMIGESHCMIFKDRLFTETSRLNQTFVTRGLFIPTITAHNFVENGALNGEILKVLMGEMLLTGGARGWTAENIRPLHMGTFGVLHRPNQM